jgi:hypothetical protein
MAATKFTEYISDANYRHETMLKHAFFKRIVWFIYDNDFEFSVSHAESLRKLSDWAWNLEG